MSDADPWEDEQATEAAGTGKDRPSKGRSTRKLEPKTPRVRKDGQPDQRYLKYSEGKKGGRPKGRKVTPGLEPTKPGQRLKAGDTRRQPVNLTPIQLRALDCYFDPRCHSIEDVAEAAGVHGRTLRNWLATHPKFLAEWQRRASIFVEGFASHTIRSAIAAMDVLVSIARDEKQSASDRINAADKILRATHGLKVQVDVLAQHQHVHAVVPATPSAGSGMGGPTVPMSVQRLTGPTGPASSTMGAVQADVRELYIMVEQMGAGALTTLDQLQDSEATGIVDGEAT